MEQSNLESSQQNERIFPSIQPDIYKSNYNLSALTSDQKVARKLLALANKKFTRWERLIAWRLDAQGQIGRLLYQHCLAIEAELEGQWKQADFFWKQVLIEIKILAKKDKSWQVIVEEIAKESGTTVMKNPLEMRQRLIEELLIDTHFAFYNGLSENTENTERQNRAFLHLKYIQELVSLSSLTKDKLLALLRLPWQKEIDFCKESGNWQEAIQVCRDRLKYFPEFLNFQNDLVDVYVQKTLVETSDRKTKTKQLKNEKSFRNAIAFLKELLKEYPHNLAIFQALGILYHFYAIEIANSQDIAEALLYTEKALTYAPDLLQAYQTQRQLTKLMMQIKARAANLQQELARRPNTVLNHEGQQILNEASIGVSLGESYKTSSEAKEIREALQVAKTQYPILQKKEESNRVIIPVKSQISLLLTPHSNPKKLRDEPFFFWLFSRQELRFKMLPAFASLLLLTVGGLIIRERFILLTKNNTSQRIREAAQKQDYLNVMEAAEKFLTHTSLNGQDPRDREIQQLYTQAFLQWIVQKEPQLNEKDLSRIERYRNLTNSSQQGDN